MYMKMVTRMELISAPGSKEDWNMNKKYFVYFDPIADGPAQTLSVETDSFEEAEYVFKRWVFIRGKGHLYFYKKIEGEDRDEEIKHIIIEK